MQASLYEHFYAVGNVKSLITGKDSVKTNASLNASSTASQNKEESSSSEKECE